MMPSSTSHPCESRFGALWPPTSSADGSGFPLTPGGASAPMPGEPARLGGATGARAALSAAPTTKVRVSANLSSAARTTGPNRSVGEARRSGGLRDRGQLRPVEEQELVVADDRRAWSEMGRSSSAMGNRQWRESQEKSGAPGPIARRFARSAPAVHSPGRSGLTPRWASSRWRHRSRLPRRRPSHCPDHEAMCAAEPARATQ